MFKREIKALPEGFMDGFSSTLDKHLAVENTITKTEASVQLQEVRDISRRIRIAQSGGAGDISRLNRQLAEAQIAYQQSLQEAKMTDKEVLAAAKSLAARGKDAEALKFGKGLVDYYEKHGSFHPNQVSGLQNIMKNASFQMAKEEVELEEGTQMWRVKTDKQTYVVSGTSEGEARKSAARLASVKRDSTPVKSVTRIPMREEVELDEKFTKDTKKSDDGEGMDPVGKGDKDIDNDGDSDSSDDYLHKRRKAIAKSIKKDK